MSYYSNTTYRRSQDRRVISINKISSTFFEVIGETGNKYWYDSWLDCCNCPAGKRDSHCYHQRCCKEEIAREQEAARQEQQSREEIAKEQAQEFELESNFVSTPTYKATGMEIMADLRDAGFGVQYTGIVGRAYNLVVTSCGDKVATLKFPTSKKELGIIFVYSNNGKAVLDVYHSMNPLMSHLQNIYDANLEDAKNSLFLTSW